MTPATRREIRRRLRNGETRPQVAAALGLSLRTVQTHGGPARSLGRPASGDRRPVTLRLPAEARAILVDLAKDPHVSQADVVAEALALLAARRAKKR